MTTKHSHHHTDKLQLVFLSTPAIGNLVPTVEFARHLLNHHPQFSATILLLNEDHRPIVNTYSQSISATATNIRFIHLPPVDPPSCDQYHSSLGYLSLLINNHKPKLVTEFSDSDSELSIRSFRNLVPKNLLPNTVLKGKDGYSWYVHHGRRYMETKGIVVNTFRELESYAIDSLSSGGVPKVYPIGPVLIISAISSENINIYINTSPWPLPKSSVASALSE